MGGGAMSTTKLIVLAGAALVTGAALGFVASLLRPRHYGASGLFDEETEESIEATPTKM